MSAPSCHGPEPARTPLGPAAARRSRVRSRLAAWHSGSCRALHGVEPRLGEIVPGAEFDRGAGDLLVTLPCRHDNGEERVDLEQRLDPVEAVLAGHVVVDDGAVELRPLHLVQGGLHRACLVAVIGRVRLVQAAQDVHAVALIVIDDQQLDNSGFHRFASWGIDPNGSFSRSLETSCKTKSWGTDA